MSQGRSTNWAEGPVLLGRGLLRALGLGLVPQQVIGLRAVDPKDASHAYPVRPVGGSTFVIAPKAFFDYFNIPLGEAVRRQVRLDGEVLVVDLKDPGRVAISNRNRAKLKAENGNGSRLPFNRNRSPAKEAASASDDW